MIIRLVLICVVILLVFGTLINLLRGRKSLGVNGLKVGIIFLNKKKVAGITSDIMLSWRIHWLGVY